MWPRTIELMLACWLAVSPFVFGHDPAETLPWIVDYTAAVLVGTAALASFHTRFQRAHVVTIAVALGLVGMAFVSPVDPPPPAYQNHMCVGVLLLMFAILPSRCKQPPRSWLAYNDATHAAPDSTPTNDS